MSYALWLRKPERARVAIFLKLTWEAGVLGNQGWSLRQRLMHLFQAVQSLSPLLILIVCLLWLPRPSWLLLGVLYGTCVLSWMGVQPYLHRYHAHGAFRIRSPGLKTAFTVAVMLAFQEHPVVWGHYHRRHHQTSDTPDDPHSPLHSSLLWIFAFFRLYPGPISEAEFTRIQAGSRGEVAPDVTRDRFEARLARYLFSLMTLHLVLAGVLMALGGWEAIVAFQLVPILVIQVALFGFIQYASHRFGYKNFPDQGDDRSTNFPLAGVFASEWHQNHHHFPSSARTGIRLWELDPSHRALQVCEKLGWVSDLIPQR